jgi:predicted transcriptional regulator
MFKKKIAFVKNANCHRINTTLNSSVGTDFFVSIQLKSVIMHRSLTYLILINRLVVKSIVIQKKDQSRNNINAVESSEFGGEGHISHSLNFMTTSKDNTVRHFVKI